MGVGPELAIKRNEKGKRERGERRNSRHVNEYTRRRVAT